MSADIEAIVKEIAQIEQERQALLNAGASIFDDYDGKRKRARLTSMAETLESLYRKKRQLEAAHRNGQQV